MCSPIDTGNPDGIGLASVVDCMRFFIRIHQCSLESVMIRQHTHVAERDPDFAQKVEQQVGKDAKVLLVRV